MPSDGCQVELGSGSSRSFQSKHSDFDRVQQKESGLSDGKASQRRCAVEIRLQKKQNFDQVCTSGCRMFSNPKSFAECKKKEMLK